MRRTSLNEDLGNPISDFEALIIVMQKLLDDKRAEKPNAGITLGKGKQNERRLSYKDAQKALNKLQKFALIKGMISIGVCETCSSFDTSSSTVKSVGVCRKNGKQMHCWETCPVHSKEGGGFGA